MEWLSVLYDYFRTCPSLASLELVPGPPEPGGVALLPGKTAAEEVYCDGTTLFTSRFSLAYNVYLSGTAEDFFAAAQQLGQIAAWAKQTGLPAGAKGLEFLPGLQIGPIKNGCCCLRLEGEYSYLQGEPCK